MNRLRVGVAILIVALWAIGVLISYFDHSFKPPTELWGLMLLAATWLFSSSLRDILRNGKDKNGAP